MKARTDHDDLIPRRVWPLRKGGHEAAIEVKAVPGIGAEIVLTVDGECSPRSADVSFRPHLNTQERQRFCLTNSAVWAA